MAISFLRASSWSLGANGGTTGSNMDSSSADVLVAVLGTYTAPTATLSDNKSNTWTKAVVNPGNANASIWYTSGALTTGADHTFTFEENGRYPSLVVAAFSGVTTTSPLDTSNSTTAAEGLTLQTNEVTPGQSDSLLIAALCYNASNDPSIDLSFVEPTNGTLNYGTTMGASLAYLILGTAAAKNPTWTVGNSTLLGASIAVFKPAAEETPTFVPRIIMIS